MSWQDNNPSRLYLKVIVSLSLVFFYLDITTNILPFIFISNIGYNLSLFQ
jgi:hypothetical protein